MISEGNNAVITGSFVAIMMKNAASGPDRLSIPAFSVYHARSKNFHWRNWFELHLISGYPASSGSLFQLRFYLH